MDLWSICISTTQNARSAAMTSAPLVPITATTVKHNMNATNAALSGTNKGKIMKIQTFINEFKLTFVYDLLRQTLTDEQLLEHSVENGQVIWFKEQMRQMWLMWEKAQAVPEWIETAIQPPEVGQKVIISGIYGVGIAEFSYLYKDEFVMYDMGASNPILSKDQVKFWMPLPDAPQEPTND